VLVGNEVAEKLKEGAQKWREELYRASDNNRLFVIL